MFSFFETTKSIINELPALATFLKDAGSYFAHTPNTDSDLVKETLEEHINLVNEYFVKLIETHDLEDVINGLICDFYRDGDESAKNYIKKLFVNTIVFHDFGKVNEHFQFQKMKNDSFADRLPADSPLGTNHAALSAYIYLTKHLNDIFFEFRFNERLVTACIFLSYSIFKHHGSRFRDDVLRTANFGDFQASFNFEEVSDFLANYLHTFGYSLDPQILKLIGKNDWLMNQNRLIEYNSFSLYSFCRLNFSLLTASDYLATNEYCSQKRISDFGTLSEERIHEIHRHVSQDEWINEPEKRLNYNKSVFDKVEGYQFTNPKCQSEEQLNVLRTEMAIEVIRNVRKNADKSLFYIEAPTGGGKTNLSALATIELLKLHKGRYNKVFYVFPFTTLINQTYKALKDTLGLMDSEMVELYSNAGMKIRDNEEDDHYGDEQINFIHHLFVNYPFVFLSHVRFFDILKTNEKATNYLLHRLANSIVVIDELQSYNPDHWDKVIYFVRQYAEKFNIKFILMSATLPKLDKLQVIKENVQDIVYLLPNAKINYFRNPNFAQRVIFDFELFDQVGLTLESLSEKVLKESEYCAREDCGLAKPLGSVYTIIEFIFKKTASEFYSIVKDMHDDFFDEIFVLSGSILPHRRKYILNFLKNQSNREKKVLLITTQVVEAGVDIDMDLGFKDRSLIDSDEQLAGRINRNVKKKDCKLFLFNYNKPSIIYGNDKRLELTKNNINQEQYKEILIAKDFDKLYDIVLCERNKWNQREFAANFSSYQYSIDSLKFQSVHDGFQLIEQNNISCFLPINVPLSVEGAMDGSSEMVFTKHELDFLAFYEVFPNVNKEIEGSKVFDIYLSLIQNKKEYIKQQIEQKILHGIMSKFIFSLFANSKIEEQIILYSNEEKSKYAYRYIEHWGAFFSIDTGMRDSDFFSAETQFL